MDKEIKPMRKPKFIGLEIRDGKIVSGVEFETGRRVAFDLPATRENINMLLPAFDGAFVNVWNCQATVMLDSQTPLDMEKLTPTQREAIEKLKDYVIYTENGGAINWSGSYFFSDYSIELLKRILAGDVDAVTEIELPTEEDYNVKAEEILAEIEDNELVTVYNSALAMGCSDFCQGYHNCKYVTKQGDKWLLVDDGYGHHHTFLVGRGAVATIGVIVKEVTKQEATDRLISYLKCLGKRENWTKFELTNYTQEEGLKLYTCPKCHEHDIVYDESEHWCEEAE